MRNRLAMLLAVIVIVTPAAGLRAETGFSRTDAHWDAGWIGCPGASPTDYGVYHFRRRIVLADQPSRFVVHVSADNRYKLYVNGREAADGPARGDLAHWRYESVDLAPWLKQGENLLATVVWNCGEERPWAQLSHRTAFLLQGDSPLEAVANTDSSWKVCPDTAYSPLVYGAGGFTGISVDEHANRVVGPGDRVDGARHPWGWELAGFDDRAWSRAMVVSKAAPRGMRDGSSHWFLVPRTIPPLEKTPEEPFLVRRAEGVELPADQPWERGEAVVPAQASALILLDRTRLSIGYPRLTVSGGQGARVTLRYAEGLYDSQGRKGHRDRIEGQRMVGKSDLFLPDGGRERAFVPLWLRTYRYVQIEVETAGEPLTIRPLESTLAVYPFQERAWFTSEDSSLAKIWEVGWRTARLCAGETYFDCPYYEQLQYVGDTRLQALISLYVAGDDRLMRNAISQFDDSRLPEGLTSSRYPTSMPQLIPPFSLLWVAMVHDYWLHRDDPEFVRSCLPGVESVLGWFERRLSAEGLVGNLPWWNFVDWTRDGYEAGVPPGADRGENAVISLQFVFALQRAQQLATGLGQEDQARRWGALAARVSAAVLRHCWSPERGLFAETPERRVFSQHVNAMAVLTGLVPPQEQAPLMERVLADSSLIQCTYYYRFYLLRALRQAGLGERYLELLGPWREMLAVGLTTFAETPEPTRSDCHAWSSTPLYEFLATVAGIEPLEPGFRRVLIAPRPGPLTSLSAGMPHPLGMIRCELRCRGERISAEVELPAGLEGVFRWRGKERPLRGGKQLIEL